MAHSRPARSHFYPEFEGGTWADRPFEGLSQAFAALPRAPGGWHWFHTDADRGHRLVRISRKLRVTPQNSPTNQSISLTADPQTTDSLRTSGRRVSVSLTWDGAELPLLGPFETVVFGGLQGTAAWLNTSDIGRASRPGHRPARARSADQPRGLPHLYRGSRGRGAGADVYAADHADSRQSGRFRWLLSTCIAAAVGAVAIIVVIYGSTDPRDPAGGRMPTLDRLRMDAAVMPMPAPHRPDDGLNWAIAKTDRLQATTGATSTRYIIHETLKQRRNGREYIYAKPYVRIVSHLAPVPGNYADVIPPFNPLKLYADNKPVSSNRESESTTQSSDVSVRVVELLGGFLPGEDGQELDGREVDDLVQQASLDVPADEDPGEAPPVEAGPQADATAAPAARTQHDEPCKDHRGSR